MENFDHSKTMKMSRFLRRGANNHADASAPLGNRKTKIICTIGPVTQPVERLAELVSLM